MSLYIGEKIQITVDLLISTDTNIQIVQDSLKDQVITAKIESSVHYDDDEWKVYAKDPEVIDLDIAKSNMVVKSIRKPLLSATNGIAGDLLAKMPVYDLNKSGGLATDVAGYLLETIEIIDSQIEIQMSVF